MAEVLFVGEYTGFVGGIERYMAQSSRILSRHGHRVSLLAGKPARGEAEFRRAFAAVLETEELFCTRPPFDLVVVHKLHSPQLLARLRRHYRLAIFVHDHEYYCPGGAYYRPLGRRNCDRAYGFFGCELCNAARRLRRGSFLDAFAFRRRWRAIRQSEAFIVISGFMRELLIRQGIAPEKIALVPPVIEPAAPAAPSLSSPPLLLSVGQLIRGKGVDQLLRALPLVKGDWQLEILGDGKDAPLLRRLAAPFGDRVRFHGWCDDPAQWYQRARLMVLPWRWQEPFGLVGPEALAHGVPLVGFAVGGVGEYLLPGETGLAVPPGDLPALAGAIDSLLRDPEEARRLGEAGRQLVARKFSETAFMAGWNTLLAEGGGR